MAIELFNLVKEKMNIFVHLRIEKHGDENVSAYDVKLSGDFSNAILLKLDPELRDTFYMADRQADVEGFKKKLRYPQIDNVMKWKRDVPRTLLTLHDEHDETESLVLGNGHTDSFVFDMLEGGTVKLSCRVKLAEMTEEQTTKLLRANGQILQVSLECAPLEEKADNFEQVDLITQAPHSPARVEAESAFLPAPVITALPDPEQVETEPVKLDTPAAKPKRTTKLAAVPDAAPAAEPAKAKRTSRKAAEVE